MVEESVRGFFDLELVTLYKLPGRLSPPRENGPETHPGDPWNGPETRPLSIVIRRDQNNPAPLAPLE